MISLFIYLFVFKFHLTFYIFIFTGYLSAIFIFRAIPIQNYCSNINVVLNLIENVKTNHEILFTFVINKPQNTYN